jgi:hypothetical protein
MRRNQQLPVKTGIYRLKPADFRLKTAAVTAATRSRLTKMEDSFYAWMAEKVTATWLRAPLIAVFKKNELHLEGMLTTMGCCCLVNRSSSEVVETALRPLVAAVKIELGGFVGCVCFDRRRRQRPRC